MPLPGRLSLHTQRGGADTRTAPVPAPAAVGLLHQCLQAALQHLGQRLAAHLPAATPACNVMEPMAFTVSRAAAQGAAAAAGEGEASPSSAAKKNSQDVRH